MSKLFRIAAITVAMFALPAAAAYAQPALTFEMAERASVAAEATARANGWNVTIIVADAEGVPMFLKRLDGASSRSYEIAMRKIATSVATGLTTAIYGQRFEAGEVDEVENGVTFAGGVPIIVDGVLIGAIGTSGVRAVEDEVVSQAGVDALVH